MKMIMQGIIVLLIVSATVFAVTLFVAAATGEKLNPEPGLTRWATNDWKTQADVNKWTTNETVFSMHTGTPFLVISNRPYVLLGSSGIIRVTDEEWHTITNHYPNDVRTDTVSFY